MGKHWVGALTVGVLLGACGGETKKTEQTFGQELAALERAGSCEGLKESMREQALRRMNQALDANLRSALEGRNWYCMMEDESPPPGAGSPGGGATGAGSYSTTNNQVAGVDEPDFLKNDASHLYVLADGKLQVVKAWPAAESHIVGELSFPGTPRKLFVNGDKALVYSSLPVPSQGGADWANTPGWQPRECTYGYDCDFTGDGHPVQLTWVDLKDRAHPRAVREVRFNGSLITARRVGTAVHTVLAFSESKLPDVQSWPDGVSSCGLPLPEKKIRDAFEALREKNTRILKEADLDVTLPRVAEVRRGEDGAESLEARPLVDCDRFFVSKAGDGASFLALVSTDLEDTERLSTTAVVGRPGAVYSNGESLYVAARHDRESTTGGWFFAPMSAISEATSVHKFVLKHAPAESDYRGSAAVKGRVLNSFAMDEHAGALRIATTTGHLPSPDVHSTVTVLREKEQGNLEAVGTLDGLAPSEDIRAARFDGERGFLVTFKKTDPLFVLDLHEPSAPKVAGELKIPGFSTYLHLLDDTHLLSIGYDAADQGDFAYFQGVLMQVFDIGTPATPTLTHRTVIGTRGSSSEALTQHLAFNYFREKGLLALPMAVCEQSRGAGSFGEQLTFNGLMVYRVSAATGFDYLGGVSHPAVNPPEFPYQGACSNWWTQASTTVKRSVFMEDFVYSVADDGIHVANVSALGADVAVVPLRAP